MLKLLKGIFIGIAYIIAGLSGATVAVLLKVYNELLDACASIVKAPFKVIKKSWKLLFGIILGLVIGVITIEKLYSIAPLPISMLFSGIVIAGIPPIFLMIKNEKKQFKNYIIFIFAFILVLALPFLFKSENKVLNISLSTGIILTLFGFVTSTSLVVPGISGSMILASAGYYEPILKILTNLLEKVLKFKFNEIGTNLFVFFTFAIGLGLGVVLIANLMKKLLATHKSQMDYAILGLVSASSISIIVAVLKDSNHRESITTTTWLIGVGALFIGLILGWLFYRMDNKERKVDFLKESKNYEKEFIKSTVELLKYKTVLEKYNENSNEPFGHENKEALDYLAKMAKRDGFKVKNVDNYAMHIEFGTGTELLGILGHIDIVPANGAWNTDPFNPVIKDNRIYARGAVDDKGPVMAAYYALRLIKDLDLPVNKRIRLIIGCDEESGNRCLRHYFKSEELPGMGFSPDANYPLIYGEKAFQNFDLTGKLLNNSSIISFYSGDRRNIVPDTARAIIKVDLEKEYLLYLKENNYKGEVKDGQYFAYGKSCHGMSPEEGLNAAFILIDFLNKYCPCEFTNFICKYFTFDPYGEKLGINIFNEDMKNLSLNCGVFKIEDNTFEINVDCRIPNNEYFDFIKKRVDMAVSKYIGIEYKMHDRVMMHYVDPNSVLVKTLMNAYQEISGDKTSKPMTIGGGTYAKFIPNAVAFGPMFPNSPDVIHQPNEYLEIDEYVKNIAIYAKSIYELVK